MDKELAAEVDSRQEEFVQLLREAVAIRSVSAEPECRAECGRMAEFVSALLERLGCRVERREIGQQVLEGCGTIQLPPVVLASLGEDPEKPTIALYGHYDVQPAKREDGWNSDPWEMVEIDGKLFGRGSTDDKGPLLAWICAIRAYINVGRELPVNLKFCFEGMEESGSVGLKELVEEECKPGKFFADVDYFCISDNYWLGTKKPCLTYGLRGMAYFCVEIEGPAQDLHSGLFGGVVHEPMIDLAHLFSKLVDTQGNILIPGVLESVRKLTEQENDNYKAIDFDPEIFRKEVVGANKLIKSDKTACLQHRWRFPSLSIHGVEGAFSGSGSKTVIPKKVIGKFSLRLVPDQDPEEIEKLVRDYLEKEFVKLDSGNSLKVNLHHGAKAWLSSTDHPNYQAAAKAIKSVYGVEPDFTREGGSIPIVLTFQEASGKNVLLLPLGCCDDGAHSQNEKFNRYNYIQGIKLLAHYFEEIASISRTSEIP